MKKNLNFGARVSGSATPSFRVPHEALAVDEARKRELVGCVRRRPGRGRFGDEGSGGAIEAQEASNEVRHPFLPSIDPVVTLTKDVRFQGEK